VPTRKVDYLLIGGGLASGNCARWLREEGADGEVVVIGREPDPPYNRPECSKGYLRGEESREETYFRPNDFWEQQRIELLTRTSVSAVDVQARTATLSSKEEIEFDKALIATGANVRRLNVDGCQLDQIHYLRTLGNADTIRTAAEEAQQVVDILKKEGRVVDVHYYPNEGHGFVKRENQIDSIRRTIAWFDQYLMGKTPAP